MPSEPAPWITVSQLHQDWVPRRIGRQILILDETDSTNTLALKACEEVDADGLVVLANFQLEGRGRLGRAWLSPRGASVLASLVLVPPAAEIGAVEAGSPAGISAWLTQVSAVAACEAIRRATEITPAIKWPNDLRYGGRKLGGILIESRILPEERRAWVVGIGVNCLQQAGHFPPDLRRAATSLELVASHPIDRVEVIRCLLQSLDEWLDPAAWGQTGRVHAAWLNYAEPLGQKTRLRREGRDYAGWTVEVDPVGGLIVQLESGRQEWFDPMITTLL
ncbi:MAG TPA: biotin--[acetyl-CoA-carboxylase] ligase [Phycisphaerae bacterium]|nr:biotin--[acetyl-CoA-carboxylase] ligase [Phycisphaerae bacterium]HRY70326.1 biotin--[acetyl-CoA-carboxylase] ligase [Phycisphaerae bacterium]HSA28043.1 biotin--[acetyl-CoA-carboxylase] ligase [Phycisphaerae bacterium]